MTDFKSTPETKVLIQILEEIKNISNRLLKIEESLKAMGAFSGQTGYSDIDERSNIKEADISIMPSSLEILNLQESRPGIFKTYRAIQKKDNWVTSTEIAEDTGRSRGLESRYLNFLADNDFLLKKRVKVPGEDKATTVHYKIIGVDE
jgi:hypothetical protein